MEREKWMKVVAVRRRTRGKVEEEVIVALAEVMEAYPLPLNDRYANDGGQRSDWESEFAHITPGTAGRSKSILAFANVLRLTSTSIKTKLQPLYSYYPLRSYPSSRRTD
jgi:hypothetical protein